MKRNRLALLFLLGIVGLASANGTSLSPTGATITSTQQGSGITVTAGSAGGSGVFTGPAKVAINAGAGLSFDGSGRLIVIAGSGGVGTLTGSGASPNIQIATGSAALGNYAGSGCGAGSGVTSLSGSGQVGCAAVVAPSSLAGTATHIQKATGTGTLGDTTATESGGMFSIGEILAIDRALVMSSIIAPAALTGTRQDNYAPVDATSGWGLGSATLVDLNVTTATTITGLLAQTSGTVAIVRNLSTSTAPVTLSNADTNSTSTNRLALTGTASWIVPPTGVIWLRYSGTVWRQIAQSTYDVPVWTVDGVLTVGGVAALNGGITTTTVVASGSASFATAAVTTNGNSLTIGDGTATTVALNAAGRAQVGYTTGTGGNAYLYGGPGHGVALYGNNSTNPSLVVANTGTTPSIGIGGITNAGTLAGATTIFSSTTLQNNKGLVVGNTCVVAAGSGTLDDNAPTCASGTAAASAVIDYTTNGAMTLDGLSIGQVTGSRVTVRNDGTVNGITVNHAAAGSLAANRFSLTGNVAWVIAAGGSLAFIYDGTSWRLDVAGSRLPTLTVDGATALSSSLTVSNTAALNSKFALGGVLTPSAISGTNTDYNPGGTLARVLQAVTSAATITSLVAPTATVSGVWLTLTDTSTTAANTITITNDDGATGTAANRFLLCGGVSLVIPAGGSETFLYDSTAARWRPLSENCALSSTAAITSGVLPKSAGGFAQVASSISDNGTTVSTTEPASVGGVVNNGANKIGATCVVTGVSGTLDDYAPTCASGTIGNSAILDLTTSGTTIIDGLSMGQVTGTRITIRLRAGTNSITFAPSAAGSLAANRFSPPNGISWATVVGGISSTTWVYDGTVWTPEFSSSVGQLTVQNGPLNVNSALNYGGITTNTTTGTQDNIALPSGTIFYWTGSGPSTIDGFVAPTTNRLLTIINATGSGAPLTIQQESGGSTAANRIWATNNSAILLTGAASNSNSSATLWYDLTSARWRVIAVNTATIAGSITFQGTSVTTITTTHIKDLGTAATLSACGTGPTITGGSWSGTVTEGTAATGCVITHSATFTTSPTVVWSSEAGLSFMYTHSATAETITNAGALAGSILDYIAIGH